VGRLFLLPAPCGHPLNDWLHCGLPLFFGRCLVAIDVVVLGVVAHLGPHVRLGVCNVAGVVVYSAGGVVLVVHLFPRDKQTLSEFLWLDEKIISTGLP